MRTVGLKEYKCVKQNEVMVHTQNKIFEFNPNSTTEVPKKTPPEPFLPHKIFPPGVEVVLP